MPAIFAALVATVAPVVLFLMIPGASMSLFYIPIWLIVAATCLAIGSLVGGQRGTLISSGVLVALAAFAFLSPVVALDGTCWTFPKSPSRQVTKPARIVLDGVGPFTFIEGRHDPRDMVAVITGAEVVEISRFARGHVGSARVLHARPLEDCQRIAGRITIRTHASTQHLVDRCLTEAKLTGLDKPETTDLRLPDIGTSVEFVGSSGSSCTVVRVYELNSGWRRLIARFIMRRSEPFLTPDPEQRRLNSRDYWVTSVMKYGLGDGIGEEALKPHLR